MEEMSSWDRIYPVKISSFGSALGGELLLANLDIIGSLDHTCMHNIPQTRSPMKQKKSIRLF